MLEWGLEDRFRVLWKHAVRVMQPKQLLLIQQMFREFQRAIKGENAIIEPLDGSLEILAGRRDSHVSLSGIFSSGVLKPIAERRASFKDRMLGGLRS